MEADSGSGLTQSLGKVVLNSLLKLGSHSHTHCLYQHPFPVSGQISEVMSTSNERAGVIKKKKVNLI